MPPSNSKQRLVVEYDSCILRLIAILAKCRGTFGTTTENSPERDSFGKTFLSETTHSP